MHTPPHWSRRVLLAVLALALGLTGGLQAQNEDVPGHVISFPLPPDPGAIGSIVGTFNTHVDRVTLEPPISVHRLGLKYQEIRGTVTGVGWGGTSAPGALLSCPYSYTLPFLLRIPPDWDGGLLIYRHQFDAQGDLDAWEAQLGERNFFRVIHEAGDRHLSDVALHPSRRWAYFAVNQTGTSPGSEPGTFVHNTFVLDAPGCTAGEAIQSTRDPTIGRDHAMLAQRLLKLLRDRDVSFTLGAGFVQGAVTNFVINSGIRSDLAQTGDNHRIAYDVTSPLIFDGFLWIDGFPATGNNISLAGVTAPTMFVYGDATGNFQQAAINQTSRIDATSPLRAAGLSRIYSIRNVPLLDADWILGLTRDSIDFADAFLPGQVVLPQFFRGSGERLRPVTGALLDGLAHWVTDGTPPPTSLFNGQDVVLPGGTTQFQFARTGAPATGFPYVDDPSIDTFLPSAPATPNAVVRAAWKSVRDSLGAPVGSIVLPETACRRGVFKFIGNIGPAGTNFVFDEAVFQARWPLPADHQLCRTDAIDTLIRKQLYDPTFVSVDIDPEHFDNKIDLRSSDRLVVAIYSSDQFDAGEIVPGSLRLAGASQQGIAKNAGDTKWKLVDLNGDGRKDLRVEFRRDRLTFSDIDIIADVWGETRGGVPFNGSDVVQIVR